MHGNMLVFVFSGGTGWSLGIASWNVRDLIMSSSLRVFTDNVISRQSPPKYRYNIPYIKCPLAVLGYKCHFKACPLSASEAVEEALNRLNVLASFLAAINPVLKSCATIGIKTIINNPIMLATAIKITTANR